LIAVYDLGGGTFDVSIIELDSGVVEVRASHGNTQLGGDDFDDRLTELLAERFQEQHEIDPRTDRRAMARLARAAETAKIALSSQPTVRVQEEYLLTESGRPLHLDVEITRAEFEELIADLLEGTLESFAAALRDAQITSDDLDKVLFVGGSTRIPLVWELVREQICIEPTVAINPDEAVALGAAVQAAIIAGEPLDAILVDVTPHSLGIEVAEFEFGQMIPDRYNILIHRNTTIPTTRAEMYSAVHPSQTAIHLKIYQGEHPIASQNTLLGEFLFDQLRPEAPGLPPRITVQFDFDVNGMVQVSAVDRGSGKQARTSVTATHTRLTPSQIAGVRAGLDELTDGSWDVDAEIDEVDGTVIKHAAPELSLEIIALLARARRTQAAHPNDKALAQAIHELEAAAAIGDLDAIADQADTLIDLLYELEDE
jgi:molecular chaperone DnaK